MNLSDSKVRGHAYTIIKNSFRLDVRKNMVSNRVVDAWNELPQYVVDAETEFFEGKIRQPGQPLNGQG